MIGYDASSRKHQVNEEEGSMLVGES